ncbi:endonuclease V-like [Oppia nitens]|uniref:endonuclease V-like n=1 Tax=Oppia nitens TaxID=1686743 RepID=UPI0023DCA29B|nr:endonuclease V-like [Oppia nitens]
MSENYNKTIEDLTEEFMKIQIELSEKVITQDSDDWMSDLNSCDLIAGLDISYSKTDSCLGCVSCVVLDANNQFAIVYENNSIIRLTNQYIAGFLAFREIEFLVKEYETLKQNQPKLLPKIWLIDGNGLLHPRKFGLASHFGVLTDTAVIGVAKNPYYMSFVDQSVKDEHKRRILSLQKIGDQFDIKNSSGDEVIGVALKTRNDCKNPVYVSIGHKVSLETAIQVVLKCCLYRVPEPIRRADIISRQQINK